MAQKIKSGNNITSKAGLSKNQTWDWYMSPEAYSMYPEQGSYRKRLIHSLFEWSKSEKALELQQFLMEYRIPKATFYGWVNKHPDIKVALDEVKLILASRRRIGALTNKLNPSMVLKDLHRLDPEWIEIDKYHAMLRQKTEQQTNPVRYVVMPSVEEFEKALKKEQETT